MKKISFQFLAWMTIGFILLFVAVMFVPFLLAAGLGQFLDWMEAQ